MILYNTLMGVCVGTAALLVAQLVLRLRREPGEISQSQWAGYGWAFIALGGPLALLGGAMTLTWPLNVNPPINIAFGEPSLLIGALLLAGGALCVREDDATFKPLSWVVAALGGILLVTGTAIASYDLVGDAPAQEPITGNWTGWENTTFAVAYIVAGIGCLLAPWVLRSYALAYAAAVCLRLGGAFFLLFSLLNYRTHIGLLINLERGTDHTW